MKPNQDEYIKKETLISIFEAKADMALGSPKHFFLSMAEMVRKLPAADVIVPPVFVGQTVYHFCEDLGGVFPYFVENLNIGFMDKERNYWTYEANCHGEETDELLDEIDFDLDDIGKTVFLTREEAEKALAEREGKG